VIDDDNITEIPSNEDEPVILSGAGKITAFKGENLTLGEVRITSGAEISAEHLTIAKVLTLMGTGSLSTVAGDFNCHSP
jgi:hypothetical protein